MAAEMGPVVGPVVAAEMGPVVVVAQDPHHGLALEVEVTDKKN